MREIPECIDRRQNNKVQSWSCPNQTDIIAFNIIVWCQFAPGARSSKILKVDSVVLRKCIRFLTNLQHSSIQGYHSIRIVRILMPILCNGEIYKPFKNRLYSYKDFIAQKGQNYLN